VDELGGGGVAFMKWFQTSLSKVNAWQIRIAALAFIVLSIAGGSHMLVSAFAATTDGSTQAEYLTTDASISIPMHVVHPTPVIHIISKGSQPVSISNK